MKNALGIILAGGQGRRMDLLCHLRPKPVLPFAGKLRVIDFTLSNCIHSHLIDIAILVDYQRVNLIAYLKEWAKTNFNLPEFTVLQPEIGSYAGTADAVYRNLSYLKAAKTDTVLVLAGDHVYRMDYRNILAFHERVGADVTIGSVQVPIEDTHRFGTLMTDGDGRVKKFVEKSSNPLSRQASMGIYVFNKDVLIQNLLEDADNKESQHDFGYSILPRMLEGNRVFAYQFSGYWQDIGDLEAYYLANMELLNLQPHFSLDSTWPVLGEKSYLPVSENSPDGRIVNSIISPGCTIKGHVERSILSPNVFVNEKAIIRDSIVMADTSIGFHSVVDTSILDEGVKIREMCYIGFGHSLLKKTFYITLLGKNVEVPEKTAIGRKCKILPNTGPDDFKSNIIPSDTTIKPMPKKILQNEGVVQI